MFYYWVVLGGSLSINKKDIGKFQIVGFGWLNALISKILCNSKILALLPYLHSSTVHELEVIETGTSCLLPKVDSTLSKNYRYILILLQWFITYVVRYPTVILSFTYTYFV